jgi:hypothetical protein
VCVCVKERKKQRGEIDRTKVRVHCLKIIDGIFVKFLWSLQESKLSWTYLILWVKCPWRQKGRTDKVFNKKWILLFLWVSNQSMRSNQSRRWPMKVSKMKQGKNVENGKSTFTQKWRNRKTDLRKNVENFIF